MSSFDPAAPQPVAFCQSCGRSLDAATVRRVGQAVYCEPCLERKLHGLNPEGTAGRPNPDVPPPPYAEVPPYTAATAATPADAPQWYGRLPRPAVAGWLGLIPGVGAMYNGQFAKGVAHIIIFAILNSLEKAESVFGILVLGWIAYMSFEAYHTAKARLLGLPLPDPFGLNSIGERFGFKGSWAEPQWTAPFRADASSAAAPPPVSQSAEAAGTQWSDVQSAAAQTDSTASAGFYAVPAAPAPWVSGPAEPRASAYAAGGPAFTPVPVAPAAPVSRRLPAAGIWLIVLGALALTLTVSHNAIDITLSAPILLLAIACWLFTRSMLRGGGMLPQPSDGGTYTLRVLDSLRVAAILVVIAILQLLQSYAHISWARTWPVLVIAIGVLLLLRRVLPIPEAYATTLPLPVTGAWSAPVTSSSFPQDRA